MARSMNSQGPFLITNVGVNGGIAEGGGRSPPKYPAVTLACTPTRLGGSFRTHAAAAAMKLLLGASKYPEEGLTSAK
jgi:hypothetical protein